MLRGDDSLKPLQTSSAGGGLRQSCLEDPDRESLDLVNASRSACAVLDQPTSGLSVSGPPGLEVFDTPETNKDRISRASLSSLYSLSHLSSILSIFSFSCWYDPTKIVLANGTKHPVSSF